MACQFQTAINTGAIVNNASIVSTGTVNGLAGSASISAVGASASISFLAVR